MKTTLKLGTFLLVLGAVIASASAIVARPGEINFKRVSLVQGTKDFTADLTPGLPSQLEADNIQGIKVNTTNYDIVVKSGDQYSVREIDSSKTPLFRSQVVNNQLLVNKDPAEAHTSENGGTRLEITIPANANLQNVILQSKNGNISLNQISTKQVQIDNKNADIALNQVTVTDGGTINNTMGDIDVTQSQLPASEAESTNGDASLKGQYTMTFGDNAKLKIKTKNGDIAFK